MNRKKEVFGMYVDENDCPKYWLSILNGVKNRSVDDILIASIDSLTIFFESILIVCLKTEILQSITHQIRNSTKYVPYKDIKALMTDL